ncbi:APC family permease [Peterkaempfera griseoplana]|uniref:APC family permease n=1 Tax=Peterkaempfera griseoplana TaxID=66896 RepID=UPI0006E38F0F|nr:APC family permease [Peterkaempfera griseoplana]
MGTAVTEGAAGRLRRDVGFWGLLCVSLGSIIGSGWLLGALTAATVAGAASLVSWVLAAAMLALLALVHAELGAAYPVAGGTARFPFFAFGSLAGFTAGWMAWVQAVTIAPIEVEATLSYADHIGWVHDHVGLLHPDGTLTGAGLLAAACFMVFFTLVNIAGVGRLARTNALTVVWKTAVPLLTVVVLMTLSFHGSNFTAGGGFAPHGAHGVFAALPAGVVFALQGFEQAVQMAGEARRPQRDVPRAVIAAMAAGTVVYLLLEVAFLAAIQPARLLHGWADPVGRGDFGPYAALAGAAGAGWLAVVLYIDAVVSPAGTGLVYVAASSRLSYAMARERALPPVLARIGRRGVPLASLALALVVGVVSFLPFPSWQSLVGLATSATAIMYAFAPVALHALRLRDTGRARPYRLPAWRVLSPAAFVSAGLIVYWSGYQADWKLGVVLLVGLAVFASVRIATPRGRQPSLHLRSSAWVWPWLGGLVLIGGLGRYGGSGALPDWWDLAAVVGWSLLAYGVAVRAALGSGEVQALVRGSEPDGYQPPRRP